MARTRYTAEEIICHLRTVEIEAGKGIGDRPGLVRQAGDLFWDPHLALHAPATSLCKHA